jgi:hypothetical protein
MLAQARVHDFESLLRLDLQIHRTLVEVAGNRPHRYSSQFGSLDAFNDILRGGFGTPEDAAGLGALLPEHARRARGGDEQRDQHLDRRRLAGAVWAE